MIFFNNELLLNLNLKESKIPEYQILNAFNDIYLMFYKNGFYSILISLHFLV